MEEAKNIQEVTSPQDLPEIGSVEPKEEEKKGPNGFVITLIVILILAIFGLGGYLVYANQLWKNIPYINTLFGQDGDSNQEENNEEDPNTLVNTFEGETITAKYPNNWSIVEYYNGEGTDSLVSDITYTGLTGLKIFHEEKEIFYAKAVSGIGMEGCPFYAIFDDDSPSYRAEQESMEEEIGGTLNTVDYTNTDYIEFDWLGTTFRRIDHSYYYDTEEGNNYFEAPCAPAILVLEGLSFEDESEYLGEAYFYGAKATATDEELDIVDQILESMELK